MIQRNRRWQMRRVLLLTFAIPLGLGCATAGAAKKQEGFLKNPEGIEISRAELRIRVRSLALPLSGIIEETADGVVVISDDPAVRRTSLLWKINGIPEMQAALFQPDPLAALLDAWALTVQMRNAVLTGPAAALPEEVKSGALKGLAQMESEILKVAQLLGPTEAVEELRRDVETWAKSNPIDSSLVSRPPTIGELAHLTADNRLGIRKTVAVANETMSDLATRMDVYTSFMPKQARWQAEYLVGQMMSGEDLGSVIRDFAQLSAAVDRMSQTVALAPGIVSAERAAVLEALQAERIAALDSISDDLAETMEFISQERIEIFTTHLQAEREAVLAAVAQERAIALEALHDERIAALEQVQGMTEEVVAKSMQDLVDHFFIRLAQLGIVALLIFGIGYWLLRRRSTP